VEALDYILPRAQTAQLQRTVLESQASEMGARMVAMDNATTNAGELIRGLNLLANKLRQSGITKELLEITTGAEALGN
jgi:F-type H+-transporting ATPase subunit gamma